MANLWITGDSWGVLDKELPESHWVNYYAKHYNLKNIYCLARQGIAQDMINYMTHCVIKNTAWEGRTERWSNYDDHIIIFPTTPTRITYKKHWDQDTFDVQQGPHNLNWESGAHHEVQDHYWFTEERNQRLSNLESENFNSLHASNRHEDQMLVEFGSVHPEEFCNWRDTDHLQHIVRELHSCKIYGRNLPTFGQAFGDKKFPKLSQEQVNHLDQKRHLYYWQHIRENL
jgi:hypothetical protein